MDTSNEIPDQPPMTDQSPPVTTSHVHPPYTEMIIAAITALKDEDGSSIEAISKYIETQFTNLPPTHSTLLTHHLERLKNLGQLELVKHSYMLLPRSVQFQPPASTDYHPTLDFSGGSDVIDAKFYTGGVDLEDPASGLSKRKRGRPRKLEPVPGLGLQNQTLNVQSYDAAVTLYQSQFQYHGSVGQDLVVPLLPATENTPVVLKRGRGRPRKSAGGDGEIQMVTRGRGRPRKSASAGGNVADSGGNVVGYGGGGGENQPGVGGSGGNVDWSGGGDGEIQAHVVKRGRGRPRKSVGGNVADSSCNVVGFGGGDGDGKSQAHVVKRGRGRPRKTVGGNVADSGGNVVGSGEIEPQMVTRSQGRPRKFASGNVGGNVVWYGGGDGETQPDVGGSGGGEPHVVEAGSAPPVTVKRGRGRPRGSRIGPVTMPLSGNLLWPDRVVRQNVTVNGGETEGVSVLRKRGRPRKILVKDVFGTAVIVTDPQQLVVYQELKNKYELLQSKAKQVANIMKSCIDPNCKTTALGALQELEDLAGKSDAPSHGPDHEPTEPSHGPDHEPSEPCEV